MNEGGNSGKWWKLDHFVMKIGGLYPATFIIVVTRVVVTTDATAL